MVGVNLGNSELLALVGFGSAKSVQIQSDSPVSDLIFIQDYKVIRQQFMKLSLKNHPDKAAEHLRHEASMEQQRIADAYHAIKDENCRYVIVRKR